MSRGSLGIVSIVALLIVLGLILTHNKAAVNLERTTFSGIDAVINDLELHPRSTLIS